MLPDSDWSQEKNSCYIIQKCWNDCWEHAQGGDQWPGLAVNQLINLENKNKEGNHWPFNLLPQLLKAGKTHFECCPIKESRFTKDGNHHHHSKEQAQCLMVHPWNHCWEAGFL